MTYPVRMDPPEQVGNTVDTTTDDMLLFDDVFNDNDMRNVVIQNKYELSPRSTRGIPSKRDDLEFEAQRLHIR